ncbi:MAG: hypothetical protein KBI10_00935 [Syntrophorhabdales bacterium]|nr:hypothetical protein [Syntrophorhabdales bacterium]
MFWSSLNILSYKKDIDTKKSYTIKGLFLIVSGMLFLLLCNCGNVYGESWTLFYNSQDVEKYYFDKDSIQKSGKNIVKVWYKKVKIVDETEEEIERLHLEMDCKKRVYRILSTEAPNLKNQDKIKEDANKRNIQEGTTTLISIIGSLYENVCR